MRRWFARNWWGLVIAMVVAGLIGATISYPQWWRLVGYQQPAYTVAAGQTIEVGGVTFGMEPLTIPEMDFGEYDLLDGGRMVTYLIRRDRGGAAAGLPDGYIACFTSMLSGERRWMGKGAPSDVWQWASDNGDTTSCATDGNLVVAVAVPRDTQVTAVDLHLAREFEDNGQQPDPENADLWTLIRFQTD